MKVNLSLCLVGAVFVGSAFSSDLMVERMQGVVDEVSDLRLRYERSAQKNEECLTQVQEQNKVIKKISMNEGLDYEVFEANRDKLAVLEAQNQKLLQVQGEKEQEIAILRDQMNLLQAQTVSKSEYEVLKVQNAGLQKELTASKNKQKMLISKQKEERTAASKIQSKPTSICLVLQEDKKRLEEELMAAKKRECKPKVVTKIKSLCVDDNPFPKLMMKKEKSTRHLDSKPSSKIQKAPEKLRSKSQAQKKAGAYRVKSESAIYDAPNGNIKEVWEEKTSFTSSFSRNKWIKITGYFENRKWKKATKEMWIQSKNTLKR